MAELPEHLKLNALMIEDNIDDLELVVYELKKAFDTVRYTHVQKFTEYVAALEKNVSADPEDRFNVVLSDWAVPGYDAFSALESLQRIDPTIPFIIVSGAIGETAAVALIKAGAYEFVLKNQANRLTHIIPKAFEWAEQKRRETEQQSQIEIQNRALQLSPIAIAILNRDGRIEWINPAFNALTGWSTVELMGHYFWEYCDQDDPSDSRKIFKELETKNIFQMEGSAKRKDGSRYSEFRQMVKLTKPGDTTQRFMLIRQDISSLKQYRSRLEIDAELPSILANCQTEACLYEQTAAYLRRAFNADRVGFTKMLEQGEPERGWYGDDMGASMPRSGEDEARFPLLLNGTLRAFCVVHWNRPPIEGTDLLISHALEKIDQPLSKLIAQETAEEWLKRLSLLDILNEYFAAGQNMHEAMQKIIHIIKETLRADSICLHIKNPDGSMMVRNREGFNSHLSESALPHDEKNVEIAAREKRIVFEPDLRTSAGFSPQFSAFIEQEGFITQYCIPVVLANEVRGVMTLYFRSRFEPDQTWLAFGQAAAYQIGIVLQMQNIIEALNKAYRDLEAANESIIEGLSSALEFRDEETEGHTVRVTELFMNFASHFVRDENELRKMRIGSLLHDIGKIGIPDAVLNKPGPLTPEERIIIQQHPLISKEILSRIPSLYDCIDIPLYHHEKFDGSGYPFGLKAESIPLAARIFAIIDVYDALVSDRPYRKAWPKEKALEYIREHRGTHFDPDIAMKFVDVSRWL